MSNPNLRVRILLLIAFLFFMLPCLTYLALSVPGLGVLLSVDMGLRTVAVYSACAFAVTVSAAGWVFTHMAYFF